MDRMTRLRQLTERVQLGWLVDVTNHGYAEDSGTTRIVGLSDNVYGSGRAGYHGNQGARKTYFLWPTEDEDFEVEENVLRIYNPDDAFEGGRRAIHLTMKFRPPGT